MDLSIIILNYNTSKFTISCIKSIKKYTKNILYEIIVVDNGSNQCDYKNLFNIFNLDKDIQLIRSLQNVGFALGNNKGIDYAKGKYLCFMNNDVILIENSLVILYQFMEKTYNAAVCSCIQLNEYLKMSKINFGHYHNLLREILGDKIIEFFFQKPKRKKKYDKPIIVDFCSGSLMFFKTKFYKKIGGFDNNLFLYYEEMDICTRLKKINLYTYHVPYTKFIHLGGTSTKIGYDKKKELIISLLYIIRKNDSFLSFIFLKWFLIFKFFIKAIFKFKHWQIFFLLITLGCPLSHSIKKEYKIL